MSLSSLVLISGFCAVAGYTDRYSVLLPAIMALVNPSDPVSSSFVAMVVVLLLGGLRRFLSTKDM